MRTPRLSSQPPLATEHLPVKAEERLGPRPKKVRVRCACGWVTEWRWMRIAASAEHSRHRLEQAGQR